ncbi:hypothetical protein CK203_029144 [Vitis vinifera]|uniref:Reverse transcriptase domain-containing protein n=1 Tax=Vitis vinifera TaxID=29760 RepID=A0A438IT31_VITVI|nr:hypothetical protein CK203_029144 [Vitis vinifera]
MGNYGLLVAENLEVISFSPTQSPLSSPSPSCGLASSFLSPSVPNLPNSAFHSQFPMENRVTFEFFSKKDDVGTVVSKGVTASSPSGEFKIEGPSPKKMAKAREVLKSLDINVYSGGKTDAPQETKKAKCDRSEEVVIGSFSISVKFALNGCGTLSLSTIYGLNSTTLRKDFWVELSDIFGLSFPFWCVGGNFNIIRRSSEKLGGSSLTPSMKDFDDFIRECELIDSPLRSTPFTWSNMQESLVCKRLDRFLYSNEWEQLFPQSLQEVLPRWTSDHWPIVLETNPFKCGPTPFRRNRKYIKVLENEKGLVLNNSESIKEEILRYFEKLYSSPSGESWRVEDLDWSLISGESASRLDSPFTEEEISKAIFQLDNYKAPGPDGFTIAVFQDCWDVIKEDLVRVASKRGTSRNYPFYSRRFLFKGKQILDAVLIANEIVDEKRRSGEEGVVFKIDFEKAYDHNHISRLAEMLDCKVSSWPILYLGLPLGGNPKTRGFWNPVIERISRRLDRWKKAYLSFGAG